ncbi:SIR2 family protein [Herbaspirillum rubrisubalbicans]|uniref:SIR2 family protein n=1 Tax=Herbaspirillum rubrisubalbicans TaxID=80842 RepID=UPI0015EC027C|nr:SIR2 family protein [Herbaspirillum rubrisubalbicans]
MNLAFGANYDGKDFFKLTQGVRWSLDALLQGAANKLEHEGRPPEDFADMLEEALYSDLITEAKAESTARELIVALNNPRWLGKSEARKVIRYFEKFHSKTTLTQIARALAKAKDLSKGPSAVVNFNADTLLFALLDLYLIAEHSDKVGRWEHPSPSFRRAFRGVDGLDNEATPIFHCHGAITPRPGARKARDSRDHLVFTENDYLQIAGNVATWAQSLFLFHAQSSNFLIIGHSLADPNIRKWLAWSLESSLDERTAMSTASAFTPRHIWITRKPKDPMLRHVQEMSLLHLGVRICWIEQWTDIEATIENLAGI